MQENRTSKKEKTYTYGKYTMRLTKKSDVSNYYNGNFNPVSDTLVTFTGCQKYFEKEVVESFFLFCIEDDTRVDFIVLNDKGKIIGEVILNDIEEDIRQANVRIALFSEEEANNGLGTWMIKNIMAYGFKELNLNRIYLDVLSFNDKAIHLYKKMGFIQEGVLRQAVLHKGQYADEILMAILKEEWDERDFSS